MAERHGHGGRIVGSGTRAPHALTDGWRPADVTGDGNGSSDGGGNGADDSGAIRVIRVDDGSRWA